MKYKIPEGYEKEPQTTVSVINLYDAVVSTAKQCGDAWVDQEGKYNDCMETPSSERCAESLTRFNNCLSEIEKGTTYALLLAHTRTGIRISQGRHRLAALMAAGSKEVLIILDKTDKKKCNIDTIRIRIENASRRDDRNQNKD